MQERPRRTDGRDETEGEADGRRLPRCDGQADRQERGECERLAESEILDSARLSNAVEHVLQQLLRTLAEEARPLLDASLPARGRKRARFTETTAAPEEDAWL